jgi:hypothetical protein
MLRTADNKGIVYAYPRLSKADFLVLRIGGNGLGNLLFTWARCLSRSRREGWRMIWPTWYSHKPKNKRVNPYDIRTYGDLFRPTGDYISGIGKARHLIFRRHISEAEARSGPPQAGCVVQFRGMADKFRPFLRDLDRVRTELLAMTRERHLAGFRAPHPAPIALHVRRGDFRQRASYEETVGTVNSLLPLGWYMSALEAVRRKCGKPLRAWVFSDGTEEELAPLLAMEQVERAEFGSSIADILALSRSRLLIASGSTFSQWGTYLGQVPTIAHPGKIDQHLLLDHPEREIEWAPGNALPDWIAAVCERAKEPFN